MLEVGVRDAGGEGRMRPLDVSEVLAASLGLMADEPAVPAR
jgi:hypothetical protein